ncbi:MULTISPECIES: glutaredoxin domain-containing protein [unclassified Polaribacter]|uniref:glutaredoxin domain-containing protein n=1 Tax=unclassified Polaribacter TaxID=196858 RepID=UPI0011BF6DF8|nr:MULTISPECIES: glutaredoxin domain-containing protein [unclassified Polaribacter]TXD52688.1 glutaredoxin family protein [Polaribacter sp. IC063]TXD60656.1 glutaredoxin family protein [Polaribacter sp. IC066]
MKTLLELYGTEKCSKTNYYKAFLKTRNIQYAFLDIAKNEVNAEELRNLYQNKKLNFTTLTFKNKK